MNYTRLYPRFPAERFVSQSEFTEYCRAVQPALDTRYRHETSLTTRDDCVVQLGTCAPCLRRAAFTSDTAGWERLADGRRVPDWSDGLACDCADGLGSRARGLLHFAQSVAHLRSWSRLLLFGPASQADGRLAAEAGQTSRVLRLLPGGAPHEWRLPAEDGAFHIAVAADCLHRVPPLRAALAELRRVLSPGGSLVFSVPFSAVASICLRSGCSHWDWRRSFG